MKRCRKKQRSVKEEKPMMEKRKMRMINGEEEMSEKDPDGGVH